MKPYSLWALSLMISSATTQAGALESQWELAMAAAYDRVSDSALFEGQSNVSQQALLQGALQYEAWEGQVSALHQAERGGGEDSQLVVEELFWQGSWQGWDWLLGKRRLDFGVGYGHRPLDWFLPIERNPVSLQVSEGVGVVSASRFTESGELSVMLVDADISQVSNGKLPKGVAIRWYQLGASAEWQLLGYMDDQRGMNLGGSWVNTYGEQWEIHSEWHYQQEYWRWQTPELTAMPKQEQVDDGWQALVGMTWANSIGHSVILEYWFDNRAWGKSEWSQVFDNSLWYKNQGVQWDSLRQSFATAFLSDNPLRHNLLLHWTLSNNEYHPKVDLIYTPEDSGLILTIGGEREITDDWVIGASARFFGGRDESAFAQLQNQAVFTLSTTIVF
ncbi:hypothetical protein BTJ40_07590 [Microbulbifer sp. A4B17]|uniref:hypothetical protein n=1 Tax=Microbulbifer sp. A4B17 TaxID=359370 RepID=UPI000D52C4D8|nr:hypothetical protein [Microbulbifer sp. A4B17]AWF80688.1 hypothetical protein BTJ40_07590 [Microbulbifer sp. A4B17]